MDAETHFCTKKGTKQVQNTIATLVRVVHFNIFLYLLFNVLVLNKNYIF